MSEIKVIFFDLDNTLFDHQRSQDVAIRIMADKYNLPFEDFSNVYRFFNARAWDLFRQRVFNLADMRRYRFALTLEALGIDCHTIDPVAFNNEYLQVYTEEWFLCPYADTVIPALAERFKIAILTNGFRDTQTQKVYNSPIGKYITYLVAADDIDCLKPDSRFFEHAVRISGAHISEIIHVGDSWDDDVVGALGAGLKTIWYNSSDVSRNESNNESIPHLVIRDLRELLTYLDDISTQHQQ